jgi:hypothetical protein
MKRIKLASCASILFAVTVCFAQEAPNPNLLTEPQKQALDKAKQSMESETKTKTIAISLKLAALAKSLDRNMLADQPDPETDKRLLNDLTQTVTEMVAGILQTKISADREVVKLLTPEQKKILLAEIDKADANPDLAELIGKLFGGKK